MSGQGPCSHTAAQMAIAVPPPPVRPTDVQEDPCFRCPMSESPHLLSEENSAQVFKKHECGLSLEVWALSQPDLPLASASSDMVLMEQGPTELHAGRSTFLLSSSGARGGYYWVAFGTGPIPTANQFPCQALVACLITTHECVLKWKCS